MRRVSSLLVLFLLARAEVAGAATPTDVQGWESLSWHASVSELAEHLGRFPTASSRKLSEFGCDELYGEHSVGHLGLQFEWATFCFKEGRLVEVVLTVRSPKAQQETDRVEILAKLEAAYGPAMLTSDGKSVVSASPHHPVGKPVSPFHIWQFKSSRISYMEGDNLNVVYVPIGANPDFDADMEAYLKLKKEEEN